MLRMLYGWLMLCPATVCAPSTVEQRFLTHPAQYQGERVPVIEVTNTLQLGKLVALRFIEWVITNPAGVISLPTGKTPEHFIKFLKHYQEHWHEQAVQQELKTYGITALTFPDTSRLKFVQMDEFFPINPAQKNSFAHYINTYYLPLLHLKPENILTIDACQLPSMRTRSSKKLFPAVTIDPTNSGTPLTRRMLQEAQKYCETYEEKIRQWGGIGFFLGGIGPDGHIAFNMYGTSPDSTTRITMLNYKSAAAAATDLGGIEYARNKAVITIGLQTITLRPDAVITIIAAGQAKAPIVAASVEGSDKQLPVYSLLQHPGTRFYVTTGAASNLRTRRCTLLAHTLTKDQHSLRNTVIDEIIHDCAVRYNKKIIALTHHDLAKSPDGVLLLEHCHVPLEELLHATVARLQENIERGLAIRTNLTILHTEPHHDDVMLSYHPLAVSLLAQNRNTFVTLTSGFNAVTNKYLMSILEQATDRFIEQQWTTIIDTPYEQLLTAFDQAIRNDTDQAHVIEIVIALKNILMVFGIQQQPLRDTVQWIQEYLAAATPGEKDIPTIQLLKGALRESEVDRLWTGHGVAPTHIHHLRAKFYTGDYFTPQPTLIRDVAPVLQLMESTAPDIVTVALDPEGTGPDTHYKVLQIVAEAVRSYYRLHNKDLVIWGYRNVWFRFKPHEATFMMPVSEEQLKSLHHDFMNNFSTQRQASFPALEHDGPFSELSCIIQRQQLATLKLLLGEDYFAQHPDLRMRSAAGMLFLKQMNVEDFVQQAAQLQTRMESV